MEGRLAILPQLGISLPLLIFFLLSYSHLLVCHLQTAEFCFFFRSATSRLSADPNTQGQFYKRDDHIMSPGRHMGDPIIQFPAQCFATLVVRQHWACWHRSYRYTPSAWHRFC
ncbi:hypothetical protein GGI35DRAFT_448372 [Trichoderma velutinum]